MSNVNTKKILIVEDEPDLSEALSYKLSQEGFQVFTAANGKEGLDEALRQHPDLILLDIIMPEMDGNTMAAELHKDSWGKTAKIVFLTNVGDTQRWASSLGGPNYLVKSGWSIDQVVLHVKKMLGLEMKPISAS